MIKTAENRTRERKHAEKHETPTVVRVAPSVRMDAYVMLANFGTNSGNRGDCSAEISAPALRGVHSVGLQLTCSPSTECRGHVCTDQITVLRKGSSPPAGRKGSPKLLKTSNVQEHGKPSE